MALWWSCCPDLCNLQSFWKQLCSRLGSKIYEHVSQRVETSQFSFQKIIGGITFHQQNWEQGKSRNGMELLPPCFFFRRNSGGPPPIWKRFTLSTQEVRILIFEKSATCSHSSDRKWPQVAAHSVARATAVVMENVPHFPGQLMENVRHSPGRPQYHGEAFCQASYHESWPERGWVSSSLEVMGWDKCISVWLIWKNGGGKGNNPW